MYVVSIYTQITIIGIPKFFLKLCTGNGAGAVTPAGSKLGSGAGAEKAQISWARLFARSRSRSDLAHFAGKKIVIGSGSVL